MLVQFSMSPDRRKMRSPGRNGVSMGALATHGQSCACALRRVRTSRAEIAGSRSSQARIWLCRSSSIPGLFGTGLRRRYERRCVSRCSPSFHAVLRLAAKPARLATTGGSLVPVPRRSTRSPSSVPLRRLAAAHQPVCGDAAAAGAGLGRPADRGRVRVQPCDGSALCRGRGLDGLPDAAAWEGPGWAGGLARAVSPAPRQCRCRSPGPGAREGHCGQPAHGRAGSRAAAASARGRGTGDGAI
jgi:hypothetical protein